MLAEHTTEEPGKPPAGGGSSRAIHAAGSDAEPGALEAAHPGECVVHPACAECGESPDGSTNKAHAGPAAMVVPLPPSRWGVMRYPHYRNIVAAQLVSNCGNWMEMVGMQMYVATVTGSLKWLGYLGAAQLTPILVLGTLGGLVADRVDRRRMLVITQIMLMLTAVVVAAVSMVHWEPGDLAPVKLLLAISVVQGIVMAFNMPAWQVLTPRLVPREELTRAITVNGIQFNLSRVVGPALAGVVMGWFGVMPLFVVNAVSFLAVVVAVTLTPPNPAPPSDGKNPWSQIKDAAGFIFNNRGPAAVFWATVVMSALAAPLVRFLAIFIIDVYGIEQGKDADHTLGWMLGVQGIGAVIGGLALRYVPSWYPKHHLIPVAILANGLFITLFAIIPSLWAGYPLMLVIGFFWIWAFNQSWAAMQHLAPDAMRGRVMALAAVASFGATAVGTVLGGAIGEILTGTLTKPLATQLSIAALSGLLLAAGFIMLFFRTPEVDGLPRTPPRRATRWSLFGAITAREHRPGSAGD
ncbi:MAG: MFS transporter [Phycisphaerales bacterium]